MPKISVIIPLYNKEKTIKQTIESVLNQTFTDFEIIVVNDGSTDRSLEIVKRFNDSRIRIIDKQNEGVSATRNRGAKEAKCNLLFFLDADDLIYSNCLESLYELSRNYTKADLWSCCFKSIFQEKEFDDIPYKCVGYVESPTKLLWERQWGIRIGSFLITKSSFVEMGMFPINITIGEDMWFQLKYFLKYKCAHIDEVLMCYVKDNRTLSKTRVNLEKTCEWHAVLNSGDKYVNRKFASLIGKSLIVFVAKCNLIKFKLLLDKYCLKLPYIMFWTIIFNIKKYFGLIVSKILIHINK